MLDLASPWFWFSLASILLICEMLIPGTFFAAIFSISAVITGLLSPLIPNVYLLVVIFAVLSFIGIVVAKPILEKHFKVNKEVRASTIDALIGKKGYVTKPIKELEKGRVKVGHEDWAARSLNGDELSENEEIIVRKIEGATLVVEKVVDGGVE